MNDFESRSPDWLGADEPLPLEVLDAIRVADREDGSAEQVSRLEARLAPLFLQSATAAESPAPQAASTSSSSTSVTMLKLAGACVALVGVAALVWPQREQAIQRSAPAQVSSVELAAREPARFGEPAEHLAPAAPTVQADESPTIDAVVAKPADVPVVSESTRTTSQQDTLALEARLLSKARRALEADPAQALKLAERHQQRFPHGVLSEEREAIAIKALRQTGNEASAARRQARFLTKYPQSPHAMSLIGTARQ